MDNSSDEQLVLKIQAGDMQAFELLFWRYKDRVIAAVYAIVRNRQDALEISQECFIRVYKNIHKFQPETKFFPWVYRIAYNLSVDRYRRRRTAKEVEFDNDFQKNFASADIHQPQSLGANPDRVYARAELREQIHSAMGMLSEKHRAIIVLREVDGLTYEEIAQTLEIQVGTVMSRLHHARRNLQRALKGYLDCEDIPEIEEEG
ncbi:MAG: sigma-70 family RNA polymerase sigma factor [Proteobacteria bacterium]|nr:sigma-70 family RNA polymerase sigma factor [Pseudomonadota bacterium]